LYSFFTNYYYDSIEAFRLDDNQYYYLCRNDFVPGIDKLFTNTIIGYTKNKAGLFKKQIGPGLTLTVDASVKRQPFETVENYSFPNVFFGT